MSGTEKYLKVVRIWKYTIDTMENKTLLGEEYEY